MKKILGILLCVLLLCGMMPSMATASFAQAYSTAPVEVGDTDLRYGYTTLEGNCKYVYEQLVDGVNRTVPLETIPLDRERGVSIEDVRKAMSVFIGDYPECFWFRNKYSYGHSGDVIVSIVPTYSFVGDALIDARIKMNKAVDAILADLPQGSNYDKALYLHDVLARRVNYEMVGEHQTAYGALVDGRAVCAGYAVAYHLLLKEAGILACTLSGISYDPATGEAVNHAWNAVWLDAETCVYTDVTWDDQGEQLYHYYFNLSLDEMSEHHILNALYSNGQIVEISYFTLPACDHKDQSYFDKNGHVATDQSTVDEVAAMFGDAHHGTRTASIWYVGEGDKDFSYWLNKNSSALYSALGGRVGTYSCSFNQLGNEIQVTVTGNFPTESYRVTVGQSSCFTTNAALEQYVKIGEEMEPMIFTVADGWYVPEDWDGSYIVGGGIGNTIEVKRLNYRQISITGMPKADADIVLKTPAVQLNAPVPQAIFTATGTDSGVLSGLEDGMRYTMDGNVWVDITSGENILLTELSPGVLSLIRVGNGTTTSDSLLQTILISRFDPPNLTATQLATVDGFGSIPTTVWHEYSTDGTSWQACNGELTNLAVGTYYVRRKAQGTTLASEAQTIVIYPYGQVPTGNGSSPAGGGGSNGGGGSAARGCFAFTLGVEEFALILTCLTAVWVGKKRIFVR